MKCFDRGAARTFGGGMRRSTVAHFARKVRGAILWASFAALVQTFFATCSWPSLCEQSELQCWRRNRRLCGPAQISAARALPLTLIFLNFERPIILTTNSRNKKALPEYPHRGYSGSAFITTNAVVGGTCRHSGCVNNAVCLPAFHFLSSPNSSCCRSTSLRRLAFSTLRRCSSRILTDDWRDTSRAWPVVWGIEAASEAS